MWPWWNCSWHSFPDSVDSQTANALNPSTFCSELSPASISIIYQTKNLLLTSVTSHEQDKHFGILFIIKRKNRISLDFHFPTTATMFFYSSQDFPILFCSQCLPFHPSLNPLQVALYLYYFTKTAFERHDWPMLKWEVSKKVLDYLLTPTNEDVAGVQWGFFFPHNLYLQHVFPLILDLYNHLYLNI